MEKLTKSKCLTLLSSNTEFGYLGVYDCGVRIDNRKMGTQYIIELLYEMVNDKKNYKTIEIYYGGFGSMFNTFKPRNTDNDYFGNAYYEMI